MSPSAYHPRRFVSSRFQLKRALDSTISGSERHGDPVVIFSCFRRLPDNAQLAQGKPALRPRQPALRPRHHCLINHRIDSPTSSSSPSAGSSTPTLVA
ncbi:unnamed protein product [Jaminaea pallidilutea]